MTKMTFQARKTRERRKPDAVGVGKPLTPSASIRAWYDRQLTGITNAMLEDYMKELNDALAHPEVEIHFATDAAANDIFQRYFKKLQRKWTDILTGFATQVSKQFVDKIDTHSKATAFFSLSAAGVKEPRTTYDKYVDNTRSAAQEWNKTLITKIGADIHEKLYTSIMASVVSPKEEAQGSSGIQNALKAVAKDVKDMTTKRIDLITRDQTSKINASLSSDRMKQNGVEHFKWLHSSAGKEENQRESHKKMNDRIFEVDDPRLWEVGGEFDLLKGDLGPPGWAINCRCRAVPIIGPVGDDDEFD